MTQDLQKIVWLASYPKSGSTWTRIFLANYLRNCDEPVGVNAIDTMALATFRLVFDELVGVSASLLPAHVVARLRPEVYRQLAREAEGLYFVKVHDSWRRTDTGAPMFPSDATAAVVYVVRNPCDVAVSLAHHAGCSLAEAVTRMCDHRPNADGPLDPRDGRQLAQETGTWSDHVRSWVDDSGLPVLVLRYEDLCLEPHREFGRLVNVLRLPANAERLARAVHFSRFEELQRQERAHGFRERPLVSTAPFFRRGQVDSGRRELGAGLVTQLMSVCGETMRRFGYLDEAG